MQYRPLKKENAALKSKQLIVKKDTNELPEKLKQLDKKMPHSFNSFMHQKDGALMILKCRLVKAVA